MANMFLVIDPAVVSSPCPLLPTESAEEFLPAACMQVPKHSAWIPMQLNISRFATPDGVLRLPELARALRACVDRGDRLHDETAWREPRIEYDSWLNRRLAITLRGWGDLVALRCGDPGQLDTLRELESLAQWICQVLHSRSRHIANRKRCCPALDAAGRDIAKEKSRLWKRGWQQAFADAALRHRNLTTMSPWDIFPGRRPADLRFADLLPLLRFADSLSFQRNVSIAHWDTNDFKGFYERVAAIVRCNGGAGFVAKQV